MRRRNRVAGLAATLFAGALHLSAGAVQAADFTLGGDPSLDCGMTLTGTILPGDAEKFRAFLPKYVAYAHRNVPAENDPAYNSYMATRNYSGGRTYHRLCLDSPGGSLAEAIEIADTLVYGYKLRETFDPALRDMEYYRALLPRRTGTAIPAGARCESACAILFMAGGYFSQLGTSDNGRDPDRVLHVDGKLGFHAPSLAVGEGSYSKADVSKAYGLAITSTERLSQRQGSYWFPPSLMVRMLSTPPEEMFYVDTVEKAASWAIQLAGAPTIRDPSQANLQTLCQNMRALSSIGTKSEVQYSSALPRDIADDSLGFFSLGHHLGHRKASDSSKDLIDASGELFIEEPVLAYDSRQGCKVYYAPQAKEVHFQQLSDVDHGLRPEAGTGFNWALLPGHLTLAELSVLAKMAPGGVLSGRTLTPPLIDYINGTCAVYSNSKRLIEAQSCVAAYESRLRADRLDLETTLAIRWLGDGLETRARIWIREQFTDTMQFTTGQNFDGWINLGPASGPEWDYDANRHKPQTVPARYSKAENSFYNGRCFERQRTGEIRCFYFGDFSHSNGSAYRR